MLFTPSNLFSLVVGGHVLYKTSLDLNLHGKKY